MNTNRSVLCIGEALWDRLPGGAVPGGAPMHVAMRLVSFGTRARLLTRVGTDGAGQALLAYMAGQGLDTRCVQSDARWPTGYVEVDTRDSQSVRYDIAGPVAWDFVDAAAFLAHHDEPLDVIVFGSLGARHPVARESQLRLLREARLRVFDVNRRPPFDDRAVLEVLLEESHWAKFNEVEIAHVLGWHGRSMPPDDAARWLSARYRLPAVCVTLGDKGALLLWEGCMYRRAAYPVTVADTVGCGDAFLGVLLAGLLDDLAPGAALARACAAGAIVATRPGGSPRVGEADIRELMAAHGT